MPLFCKDLMADFAFSLILSLKPKQQLLFPSIVKYETVFTSFSKIWAFEVDFQKFQMIFFEIMNISKEQFFFINFS